MSDKNNFMISIDKAVELIHQTIKINKTTKSVLLENALHSFLAHDVYSSINMPPFHQSAMDGYALLFDENHVQNFNLVDEIKAGDNKKITLKPGQAVRVFTGAPIPTNANAVIMQEKTNVDNHILVIADELTNNKNIRSAGEQIEKGQMALSKGSALNPASIGYLATLGITEVIVYDSPKINIVVTGNELVQPGNELAFGQIYESNAIMLKMALIKKGFQNIHITKVKDDYIATKTALKNSIENHDFVLISGGISVGDYDFVKQALEELGTEQVFYKIKQKPGKPLFFGINQRTAVFALPGNPASALTCFYKYVSPALQQFIGNPDYEFKPKKYTITDHYTKKGTRAEFLKAQITENEVRILDSQSSAMLNSYALTNGLIFVPEETTFLEKGSLVNVYPID